MSGSGRHTPTGRRSRTTRAAPTGAPRRPAERRREGPAAGLGVGAHLGLVPDAVAWAVGGPVALGVEAFALYALIAWHRTRRARRAAEVDEGGSYGEF